MRAVRAEHRRGRRLSRDDPAHGPHIDENTAARTLRRAADNAGTARAGSCRLTPAPDGRTIHATMTLTADPSHPLLPQADQVRQSVLYNAQHTLGLAVTRVDITIDDLHTPTTPPSPDRDATCHVPRATTESNESGPWTGPRLGLVTALATYDGAAGLGSGLDIPLTGLTTTSPHTPDHRRHRTRDC
ncbi:hypothetical protein J5Y04_14060 [Kitasatospora sp. RG8]|uniref:hypothetical protein n=1 Tax=Kitasatospora sp. RG8 TaxID=2820815 RepID=UPI001ADFF0FB|nr:hypothetical protein [Kitasatospora sp. RG8]MBP0450661.1 hypothetical protein [Kitasatospora sp. RG8]